MPNLKAGFRSKLPTARSQYDPYHFPITVPGLE